MRSRLRVLVASRSAPALKALMATCGAVPGITCNARLVSNGHADPMHGVTVVPDVLILRFDAEHLAELAALAEGDRSKRPPLLIVGPAGSTEAFRLAVRAGARDFLTEPVKVDELSGAIDRIRAELRAAGPRAGGAVTAVLGAAGGVGTSFLACNLAHAFATEAEGRTLLLDLDLSFAPVAAYLDLTPERGILEALAEVDALDEHAVQGYVAKHASGLHVLGVAGKTIALPHDVDPARFAALLDLLASHYQQIVVDLPHHPDPVGLTALGMTGSALIVLQQSVAQLRSAVRLVNLLGSEVGMPRERMRIVVNRYNRRSTVELEDIERALGIDALTTVPSQYESALSSIDSGIPLVSLERSSAIGRAVLELQAEVRGVKRSDRGGLLRRALPLFGKD